MGFCSLLLISVILVGALAVILPIMCPECVYGVTIELPPNPDGWWGLGVPPSGAKAKVDESIRNFKVKVDESVLEDLRERLNRTRFVQPLENVNFEYGFHAEELKKIVEYWKNDYDWRKQEKYLNSFDQYLTRIEGIDIHFIRVVPTKKALAGRQPRSTPLVLIHGWPGSVLEFYKVLPMLTDGKSQVPIEVICPSIPGYGFSEDPHQPGFDALDAARIFDKLMQRLGHKEYYVQGGDWGSLVAKLMATFYPDRVRGVLLNLVAPPEIKGIIPTMRLIASLIAPSLVLEPEELKFLHPFSEKFNLFLRETGYLHIQATKPDTVGAALTDSPAGLAAYLLEKFSTWTDVNNIHRPDGALTKKFTLDELLTNVMLYWLNGKVTSSMRFYKETVANPQLGLKGDVNRIVTKVPAGLINFPEEFYNFPVSLTKHVYENIIRVSYPPRGGHFAAFEEPQLLSDEIFAFIDQVEKRRIADSSKPKA